MKKNIFGIVLLIGGVGCSSSTKREGQDKEIASQPTLIELKKKCLPDRIQPVKGPFLEYIYTIKPDHKEPGYKINTFWLGHGYGYGEGPYDSYLLEFFLFRGKGRDLVLMQKSGYDTSEERKFGYTITPYFFENKNMTEAKLEDVLPLKEMELLFEAQTSRFQKMKAYTNRKEPWSFYKLVRLPLLGTNIELKICRDAQEKLFLTESPCALVGALKWNKSKFTLQKLNSFEIANEKY